jgi:hypothetical protein
MTGGIANVGRLSAAQVAVAGKQLDQVRQEGADQKKLIDAAKPPSPGDGRGRLVNTYA